METPIKMDDLGVPLFLETPMYEHVFLSPNEKKYHFFYHWKIRTQLQQIQTKDSIGAK